MKTKVVQHVPRINLSYFKFQIFKFFQILKFSLVPSFCLTFRHFFLLSQLEPIRHVLHDQLWALCFGEVGLGLWVEPVARSIAQMAKDFPRICFNCNICILLTQIMYPPNRNSVSFRMKTSFLNIQIFLM